MEWILYRAFSCETGFLTKRFRATCEVIMFHCRLALVCVLAGFVWHTPALAWGHPGHQLVGSLADELIMGTNASKKVAAILGPQIRSLQTAATWPDCVRDVQRSSSGTFKYNDHSMYHSPACVPFEGAAERKRMEEFARRNWTNCPGEQGKPASECHKQFHFADVAVQHRDYKRTWAGTSDLDVVSAIQAAIGVLRNGPPATAPFSIKTKKEALFMLAHFVGDLHQPLHVGAIYLADDGSVVNPDSGSIPLAEVMQTRGGNKLEIGVSNLHSEWDDIPSSITLNGLKTGPGKKRRQAMIAAARAVEGMTGDLTLWPVTWASDTVTVAQNSFTGLRFSRKGVLKSGNWVVQFNDQTGYDNAKERVQQQQLVKAAANLAQLLKAIWP